MTPALFALVGYAVWTMLLVLAIALTRGALMLAGKKRADEFPGGVPHGGDRYWRLNRAHLNAVENLPIVAIIIIVGTLVHHESRWFMTLPLIALGARVVQSLVHIASGSLMAINLRFAAFFTQYVCFAWMIVEILRGLPSGARFW